MGLSWFLTKLRNETVTIELKNSTIITGTIDEADAAMNIYLRKVNMVVNSYKTYQLNSISIRGRFFPF
jgi:small nuclear ribonucleoprotein D1